MSKSIVVGAFIIAATVLFGYLGAAMLEAEMARNILAAIVLTALAEVGLIVVNRLRGRVT